MRQIFYIPSIVSLAASSLSSSDSGTQSDSLSLVCGGEEETCIVTKEILQGLKLIHMINLCCNLLRKIIGQKSSLHNNKMQPFAVAPTGCNLSPQPKFSHFWKVHTKQTYTNKMYLVHLGHLEIKAFRKLILAYIKVSCQYLWFAK